MKLPLADTRLPRMVLLVIVTGVPAVIPPPVAVPLVPRATTALLSTAVWSSSNASLLVQQVEIPPASAEISAVGLAYVTTLLMMLLSCTNQRPPLLMAPPP